MNLNTIELKDFLIGELYHDNLLDSPGFRRTIPPQTVTAQSAATDQAAGTPTAGPAAAAHGAAAAQAAPGTQATASPTPPPATASQPSTQAASAASQGSPTQPAGNTPVSAGSQPSPAATSQGSPAQTAPGAPAAASIPASAPARQSATPSQQTSPQAASTPPPQAPTYKFLGNNRRRISIIVQSPGIAFLPDDQLNFLTKMLEACKMNMGDVAIVNHAATPVRMSTLKPQLQPAYMLLFGTGPVEIGLPMDFPIFKIQPYDQCSFLSAPSLREMLVPGEESKLLKSKLWVSLKTLFEI